MYHLLIINAQLYLKDDSNRKIRKPKFVYWMYTSTCFRHTHILEDKTIYTIAWPVIEYFMSLCKPQG